MSDIQARLRTWIKRGVTTIVVTSTVTSTVASYISLTEWAVEHNDGGWRAAIFPGFIDSFPLAAEAVLILAYLEQWKTRSRVLLWVILTFGLAVSIGLNVGQVFRSTTDFWTLVTHALPPLATWLSLVVGMLAFKRSMASRKPATEDTAEQDDEQVLDDDEDDELEYVTMQAAGPDLKAAADAFAEDIAAGKVPGVNRIRKTLNVGHGKAPVIQAHLKELAQQAQPAQQAS